MGFFLIFAAIGWLVVTILITVDRRLRESKIRSYRLPGILIAMAPAAANFFLGALVVLAVVVLAAITASQVAQGGYLYEFHDFVTSRNFIQGVLGIIFGTLLASWTARLYRSRAKDLSISQKVEGIALLFLFILGTMTISLEEFLRSVAYDKDGLSFRLAGVADEPVQIPRDQTPALLTDGGDKREARRDRIHLSFGIQILEHLPTLMKRDSALIAAEGKRLGDNRAELAAKDISEAADAYERQYAAVASCLADVTSATGDDAFLRALLSETKKTVRELHLLSLRQLAGGEGSVHAKIETASAAFVKAYETLRIDLKAHADQIRPGLVSIRQSRGLPDGRPLDRCSALGSEPEAKNALVATPGYQYRPYLALIYAALLQLENQELAGIEAIDDWLVVYAKSTTQRSRTADHDSLYRWYRIRMLHSQHWLYETLFQREPEQDVTARERWLVVSSALIDAYLDTDIVRRNYKAVFASPQPSLAATGRRLDYRTIPVCPAGAEAEDAVLLSYALLSARLSNAAQTIEHPAFLERYAYTTAQTLEEILQADMSCVAEREGKSSTSMFQAEALLAHSRMLIAEATARLPISEAARRRSLEAREKAQESLRHAKAIVMGSSEMSAVPTEGEFSPPVETTQQRQLLRRLEMLIVSNDKYISNSYAQ